MGNPETQEIFDEEDTRRRQRKNTTQNIKLKQYQHHWSHTKNKKQKQKEEVNLVTLYKTHVVLPKSGKVFSVKEERQKMYVKEKISKFNVYFVAFVQIVTVVFNR